MADYEPQLVLDSRLIAVEKLKVPLKSGPAQNNFHREQATSASTTSVNFNYQTPNQSVLIDRHITIESEMTFDLVVNTADTVAVNFLDRWAYGDAFGFNAFPFNSLVTDATLSLNNNSISISQSDILYPLMKTLPLEFFQKYQGMAPSFPNRYATVEDERKSKSPSGGTFSDSSYNSNLLPGGSFSLESVTVIAGSSVAVMAGDNSVKSVTYRIVIKTIEPLFLSPLLVSGGSNSRAMYGLNSISLNMSLDATASRAMFFTNFTQNKNPIMLETTNVSSFSGLTFVNLDKAKTYLNINLLSPQPNQLLPSRCLLNHKSYDRYVTNGPTITAGVSLSNTQLGSISTNQMPSRIFIYARPRKALLLPQVANFSLVIESLSIQVNNSATLLSTFTQSMLYKMSKKNGYQGSYIEWVGTGTKESSAPLAAQGAILMPASFYNAPTSGGVLVISPSRDLSLPPYMTSGSIGQISLQITLGVKNQLATDIANVDFYVLLENDGVFSIQAGSSSLVSGLFDMAQVEAVTSSQQPLSSDEVDPIMTGGGRDDSVSSVLETMMKKKHGSGAISAGASRSAGASKSGLDSLVF